jgi:hypothetical protein
MPRQSHYTGVRVTQVWMTTATVKKIRDAVRPLHIH